MKRGKLRIGYVTDNLELKQHGILVNRTARQATIEKYGFNYARKLARMNLKDLLTILQWNETHGIRFYRMSSGMFPHITNPAFMKRKDKGNFRKLAYNVSAFSKELSLIGEFARKHNHRLTFHPDPFISLGTENPDLLIRNKRDLYFHSRLLDIMKLNLNCTMTIHGGGAYGNKPETMARWVNNFNNLPDKVKRRIALENDEFTYSAEDVLWISEHVKPYYPKTNSKYNIPIIFDVFHYYCYNQTIKLNHLTSQLLMKQLFPRIISSWGSRRIKMHVSEQHPTRTRGAHSEYVKNIPKQLRDIPLVYKIDLDIMIEAKAKEKALQVLRKKYGGTYESLKIK